MAGSEDPKFIACLDQNCTECHDDVEAEGGLNLLDLNFDPSDPHNLAVCSSNQRLGCVILL